MVRRFFITVFCIALFLPLVFGESRVKTDLLLLNSISRLDSETWILAAGGQGILSFQALKNRNVKAQVGLKAAFSGGQIIPDIDTAYIKVRFPWFRATLGKAKLSWGEGFFFNAADVIFEATSGSLNFTQALLRDNSAWLASVYLPLGQFSFLETVAIPQETSALNPSPSWEQSKAGGRILTKLLQIKIEGGYIYNGQATEHLPYLTLQGNLWELIDWYGAVSLKFNPEINNFDVYDTLKISGGLFLQHKFEDASTLSFRLETLVQPAETWEEKKNPLEDYGLYLFPEVSWAPLQSLSFSWRTFLSPLDLSALSMVSVNWNIYQGFNWINYLGVQVGEESDRFGWDNFPVNGLPGLFLATGFRFVY